VFLGKRWLHVEMESKTGVGPILNNMGRIMRKSTLASVATLSVGGIADAVFNRRTIEVDCRHRSARVVLPSQREDQRIRPLRPTGADMAMARG
jgi:hypothetical protein